jgi:hypothetical protein
MAQDYVAPFQDDLDATLKEAWRSLRAGTVNRRSAFHHPTMATMGSDGFPRLRTLILRGVETDLRRLRFHTDYRAGKAADIARDPRVAVHAYDASAKFQVRMTGLAVLHHGDDVARQAWRESKAMSQACYGTRPVPGSLIDEGGAFTLPDAHSPDELAEGEGNFAVVRITVMSLETLYLAYGGHRRATFAWDGESLIRKSWLAP